MGYGHADTTLFPGTCNGIGAVAGVPAPHPGYPLFAEPCGLIMKIWARSANMTF